MNEIRRMLKKRPAITAVYDVQTQWISPTAFSFKAEVDFDGYVLSQRLQKDYTPVVERAVGEDAASPELGEAAP